MKKIILYLFTVVFVPNIGNGKAAGDYSEKPAAATKSATLLIRRMNELNAVDKSSLLHEGTLELWKETSELNMEPEAAYELQVLAFNNRHHDHLADPFNR